MTFPNTTNSLMWIFPKWKGETLLGSADKVFALQTF